MWKEVVNCGISLRKNYRRSWTTISSVPNLLCCCFMVVILTLLMEWCFRGDDHVCMQVFTELNLRNGPSRHPVNLDTTHCSDNKTLLSDFRPIWSWTSTGLCDRHSPFQEQALSPALRPFCCNVTTKSGQPVAACCSGKDTEWLLVAVGAAQALSAVSSEI